MFFPMCDRPQKRVKSGRSPGRDRWACYDEQVPSTRALILFRLRAPDVFDSSVRDADLQVIRRGQGWALVELSVPFPDDENGEFAVRVDLDDSFGAALSTIHDDTRGVLVVRNDSPAEETYNALVQTLWREGRWVTSAPLTEDERRRFHGAVSEASFGMFAVPRPVAFTRAGPSTGQMKTLPDLESAARSIPAGQMRSAQEKFERGEPITSSKSLACLLVRRSSAPPESTDGVNQVHPLGADSYVLVTRGLTSLRDEVAVALDGAWSEWTTEHDDPRGVLVFPAACLNDVLATGNAEKAIDRLGDLGQWVKPVSMAEMLKKK